MAAVTAAAIIGAGAAAWFMVPVMSTLSSPPNLAGLFIILAMMIALPIVSGVVSSMLTYQEVHDENFKLIQITPLADHEIIDGFVKGIRHRLRPVLRANESLALAAGATPFVLILISMFTDPWTEGVSGVKLVLSPPFMYTITDLALVLVYMWVATRQTQQMAALAGIYSAVRFRSGSIAAISVGVAGAILLTQSVISPLTVFAAVISPVAGPEADYTPVVAAVIYLLIPIVSNRVIWLVFEKYLKHTRLSAG